MKKTEITREKLIEMGYAGFITIHRAGSVRGCEPIPSDIVLDTVAFYAANDSDKLRFQHDDVRKTVTVVLEENFPHISRFIERDMTDEVKAAADRRLATMGVTVNSPAQ